MPKPAPNRNAPPPPHRRSPPAPVSASKRSSAISCTTFFVQARFRSVATTNAYYQALAYTVRDRLLARWIRTAETYKNNASRTVCYLSAKFLLGPHLGANLLNLGITETASQAMDELGLDLQVLLEQKEAPGRARWIRDRVVRGVAYDTPAVRVTARRYQSGCTI